MTSSPSPTTGSPAPLTPEEIADRPRPNDPQISPDGRHVLFTVSAAAKKGETPEAAIWLSRDGAPAKPFTSGVANDQSPRWSPDSARVAFLSDRADKERKKSKLYVIELAGGEAQPLGELEGDFSAPVWSPDGTRIAVLREDPETPEEKKKREDRDDAIVVETETKRRRLWVIDATTGKARQLSYGPRQLWQCAWSPDGHTLVVTTTEGYDLNASCGPGELWLMPAAGGLPRRHAKFALLPGDPIFVDGGILVGNSGHIPDPSVSIWFAPDDGGEPRNLLPGYKGNVESISVIGGATDRVAARSVEGTHAGAFVFDLKSATLTPITFSGQHGAGTILSGPSLSAGGARMATIWADGVTPEEVHLGDVGGSPTAVTELGKAFIGRLQPVEVVTWQSDGWEIEGLLTYPAGHTAGERYPLIVEVHGGPSWQWENYCFLDWHDWAQLLASHGFAVLCPNPRGSTGRGSEFQAQLFNDVGGGEVRDLINGAQAMVERGIADADRLGIGGWSWGGYLTAITITQTGIFKAAMMGAGLANLVSDHGTDDISDANLLYFPALPYEDFEDYWHRSAMKHIKNCTTPTLILHGDSDARVPPSQGAEMFRALKSIGVPVEFVRYPREGHPIVERLHQLDLMRRLVAWYTKWLKA
jgi:dipeptidyl aminopeptidase/acylaminoacyl peptidase